MDVHKKGPYVHRAGGGGRGGTAPIVILRVPWRRKEEDPGSAIRLREGYAGQVRGLAWDGAARAGALPLAWAGGVA